MRNIISIADLSMTEILEILAHARSFKGGLVKDTLKGKVVASCFFEASTRTRLSFESAVNRLGGKVIGFADSGATSQGKKGESFYDTLKTINCYADALIMRHPNDGAARMASEICDIPIVNAGDGANQHPTQTLLDLFSIEDSQGKLEGVSIGLMGDLKHSRTVHSLVMAASLFKMNIYFIAPYALRMEDEQLFYLKQAKIKYSFHEEVEEVMPKLDILYLTRLQKERFTDLIIDNYYITLDILKHAKSNLKILHPLPRLQELPEIIDNTPYAYYFQQVKNGLYVRQALLDILFSR